eukprot:COSAG01_NODE_10009_length_2276_cov_2.151585_3_plen_80_part_00
MARPADAAMVLPVECELAARWGTVVAPDIGTQNLAVVPTITGTLLATAFLHTRDICGQRNRNMTKRTERVTCRPPRKRE